METITGSGAAKPVSALKFAAGADMRAVQTELDPQAIGALRTGPAGTPPAAYVVRSRDVDGLRALGEHVVDRGRKRNNRGLAALMLGQARVPLVVGGYTSIGQLQRSVRRLLNRAGPTPESGLFIVGVGDRVFDELWKRSPAASPAPRSDVEAILDLLPPVKVPEELTRRYLGVSLQARLVRHLVIRAAEIDDAVLVQGDTGTGKEIVARSIHEYSPRRVETFVSVNCAAIPAELFESELFGHEPESFTGAVHRKLGLWRAADRGTLFLDEIGDLRPDHQAKLLRSLQEGTVRPVGGLEVRVRARVVTATHRDLAALVKAGRFREDLYYRLQAFVIPTPAINRHREDIPLLAQAFWQALTRDPRARLSAPVVNALATQPWPGNARELRAVLSRLHALFGRAIGPEHLEAVARLQVAGGRADAVDASATHAIECLRHLRHVADAVRACEVSLRTIALAKGRPPAAARRAFAHRLAELDAACLRPALFSSDVVFQVVVRLERAIRALPGDGDRAARRAQWERDLEPAFALARTALVGEIDRLKKDG